LDHHKARQKKENYMSIQPPSPDFYEHQAWRNNALVCGVDEVGRGCLAGPLLTAAVILPANCSYPLYDSKKMTARARDVAYDWLIKNSFYSVAWADHDAISHYNIYQATKRAMRQACLQLAYLHPTLFAQLQTIVVDAMPLTLPTLPVQPPIVSFIKGEDYSRSIAAASIIAKVTRDRLMQRLTSEFPRYHFEKHKAYATPAHCALLKNNSATFIHRRLFIATARTPKEKNLV